MHAFAQAGDQLVNVVDLPRMTVGGHLAIRPFDLMANFWCNVSWSTLASVPKTAKHCTGSKVLKGDTYFQSNVGQTNSSLGKGAAYIAFANPFILPFRMLKIATGNCLQLRQWQQNSSRIIAAPMHSRTVRKWMRKKIKFNTSQFLPPWNNEGLMRCDLYFRALKTSAADSRLFPSDRFLKNECQYIPPNVTFFPSEKNLLSILLSHTHTETQLPNFDANEFHNLRLISLLLAFHSHW